MKWKIPVQPAHRENTDSAILSLLWYLPQYSQLKSPLSPRTMLDYFKVSSSVWRGGERKGEINSPLHPPSFFLCFRKSFHKSKPCPPIRIFHYSSPPSKFLPFLGWGGRRGGKRKIKRSYQINKHFHRASSEWIISYAAWRLGLAPLEQNTPWPRQRLWTTSQEAPPASPSSLPSSTTVVYGWTQS